MAGYRNDEKSMTSHSPGLLLISTSRHSMHYKHEIKPTLSHTSRFLV